MNDYSKTPFFLSWHKENNKSSRRIFFMAEDFALTVLLHVLSKNIQCGGPGTMLCVLGFYFSSLPVYE